MKIIIFFYFFQQEGRRDGPPPLAKIHLIFMKKILLEIEAERSRQDAKWGQQNHKPIEWMPILMEEVGEASKAAVDAHWNNNGDAYLDLLAYREELVQVAAVAVAMIESIDRNEIPEHEIRPGDVVYIRDERGDSDVRKIAQLEFKDGKCFALMEDGSEFLLQQCVKV